MSKNFLKMRVQAQEPGKSLGEQDMGSGWRRVDDRTHLLATPAGPQPALLIPGTGAGRVPRKETGSWEWGIPRGQAAGPGSESTGSPRLVRLIGTLYKEHAQPV